MTGRSWTAAVTAPRRRVTIWEARNGWVIEDTTEREAQLHVAPNLEEAIEMARVILSAAPLLAEADEAGGAS